MHPSSLPVAEPATPTARPRRGMALLSAIFVIIVITLLVVGGLYSATQEYRGARNSLVEQRAFAVAEFGLNNEVSNWLTARNLNPPAGMAVGAVDTTRRWVADGDTSFVTVTRLTANTFWVNADGQASMGSDMLQSRRQTSAYVRLAYPSITPGGALTAAGDVSVNGAAKINGNDVNPPGWTACPVGSANLPGILASPSANVASKPGSIAGAPPVSRSAAAADSNTYIRYGSETWNSLAANAEITLLGTSFGTDIKPSVNGAGVCTATTANWGEPHRPPTSGTVAACYNRFPIIYATGDLEVTGKGRGQGILLVNGSLRIRGQFEFHGIVIVRDHIVKGNGTAQIYGAVYVRNAELDESDFVGTQDIHYSRCAIENALRGSAVLTRVRERHWAQVY